MDYPYISLDSFEGSYSLAFTESKEMEAYTLIEKNLL